MEKCLLESAICPIWGLIYTYIYIERERGRETPFLLSLCCVLWRDQQQLLPIPASQAQADFMRSILRMPLGWANGTHCQLAHAAHSQILSFFIAMAMLAQQPTARL